MQFPPTSYGYLFLLHKQLNIVLAVLRADGNNIFSSSYQRMKTFIQGRLTFFSFADFSFTVQIACLEKKKQLDIDVSPPTILDFSKGDETKCKDMQSIIPRHASGSWNYII